ncbi:hypothetical protein M5D96_012677, partial [Drosophila gunungcola]
QNTGFVKKKIEKNTSGKFYSFTNNLRIINGQFLQKKFFEKLKFSFVYC